jgi:hypothetical protein
MQVLFRYLQVLFIQRSHGNPDNGQRNEEWVARRRACLWMREDKAIRIAQAGSSDGKYFGTHG